MANLFEAVAGGTGWRTPEETRRAILQQLEAPKLAQVAFVGYNQQ